MPDFSDYYDVFCGLCHNLISGKFKTINGTSRPVVGVCNRCYDTWKVKNTMTGEKNES